MARLNAGLSSVLLWLWAPSLSAAQSLNVSVRVLNGNAPTPMKDYRADANAPSPPAAYPRGTMLHYGVITTMRLADCLSCVSGFVAVTGIV